MLVVGGLVTVLVAGGSDGGSGGGLPFGSGEARRFEEAVNGGDPAVLREVLAVGPGEDVAEIAREALPAGATIHIDESSFVDRGDGFAVVDATIEGARRAEVTIMLTLRDGEWVMAGTTAPVEP